MSTIADDRFTTVLSVPQTATSTIHMEERNPGCPLDLEWVSSSRVNLACVKERASSLQRLSCTLRGPHQAAWLLRALTCIDLTTLSGDDTSTNVSRLAFKAANPISPDLAAELGFSPTTAAVCVYPRQVAVAAATLRNIRHAGQVQVAAVATGFPSGQFPLSTRLDEIQWAVSEGATEIDVVIDRASVIAGDWQRLYEETAKMRAACGEAHMKTILAVGELGSLSNVYKASLVAMMAGSDFIKTSTGKEAVNATLPIGLVMCRAIRDFHSRTGIKVGFKPAGGLRTSKDALDWLVLIKEELGSDWLNNRLFRIGASGLLSDIERQLYHHVTGRYADVNNFTVA